jgi:hypothetical protein
MARLITPVGSGGANLSRAARQARRAWPGPARRRGRSALCPLVVAADAGAIRRARAGALNELKANRQLAAAVLKTTRRPDGGTHVKLVRLWPHDPKRSRHPAAPRSIRFEEARGWRSRQVAAYRDVHQTRRRGPPLAFDVCTEERRSASRPPKEEGRGAGAAEPNVAQPHRRLRAQRHPRRQIQARRGPPCRRRAAAADRGGQAYLPRRGADGREELLGRGPRVPRLHRRWSRSRSCTPRCRPPRRGCDRSSRRRRSPRSADRLASRYVSASPDASSRAS